MRSACTFVLAAALTSGCVTAQDLGSHGDGGSEAGHGFTPFQGDGAANPTEGDGTIFFTTNGLYSGNLGGLAGADTLCTNEARAAGLTGSFRAWLSTSTVNAKARIGGAGPWKFVTGENAMSVANGVFAPANFLRYDARGNDLIFADVKKVWTGTGDFGVLDASNATCNDWTGDLPANNGSFGELTWINPRWTHEVPLDGSPAVIACSARQRLYCFQQ